WFADLHAIHFMNSTQKACNSRTCWLAGRAISSKTTSEQLPYLHYPPPAYSVRERLVEGNALRHTTLPPTPHDFERFLHADEGRVSVAFIFDDVPLDAGHGFAQEEVFRTVLFVDVDERVGLDFCIRLPV